MGREIKLSGTVVPKDTIVKYQFNTKDENGNKISDKMSREKTIHTLKEIASRHGENVIVSISGDGLAALVENKFSRESGLAGSEEKESCKTARAQRDESFQAELKTNEKRHQIIPNIQTNDALVKSMDKMDQNVKNAVYGIIEDNLLKRDVKGMTEVQRQGLISLGMEKAHYIAENYMTEDTATQFLDAMKTIAKYGMNGKTDENGLVTFDIRKGPMVGMPDDYDADTDEILKEKAPELYEEINNLLLERGTTNDGSRMVEIGNRMIELFKKSREILYSQGASAQRKEEFSDWKKNTGETRLPEIFSQNNDKDIKSFIESIQKINTRSNLFSFSYIQNDLQRFMQQLEKSKKQGG